MDEGLCVSDFYKINVNYKFLLYSTITLPNWSYLRNILIKVDVQLLSPGRYVFDHQTLKVVRSFCIIYSVSELVSQTVFFQEIFILSSDRLSKQFSNILVDFKDRNVEKLSCFKQFTNVFFASVSVEF